MTEEEARRILHYLQGEWEFTPMVQGEPADEEVIVDLMGMECGQSQEGAQRHEAGRL